MMLPEDLNKRFTTPIEITDEKAMIRKKLAEDTKQFLLKSGIINEIKQGVSAHPQGIPEISRHKSFIKRQNARRNKS